LSYTSFAYSHLHVSSKSLHAGDTLAVEADVKNVGSLQGDEVAELYLAPPKTPVSPTLALAGFERLHLSPGETKHVIFQLNPRALSQVDDNGVRAVTPGVYCISLGSSQPSGDSPGTVQSQEFTVVGTQQLPR
jgi:beta-glucosidase